MRYLRNIKGKGVRRLFFDCGQMEILETHTLKMKNLLTYFVIITHVILQKMHFMSILNPLHHIFHLFFSIDHLHFIDFRAVVDAFLVSKLSTFECIKQQPLN